MYRFVFGNVALRVARRLRIGWPRQYRALLDQGNYSVAGQAVALSYTPASDTTPNAFTFTDQTGVATSTVVTSAAITISGLSVGTSITLNASGGTIDKNADANFLGSQLVANGDTVRARVTTSSSSSTAVNCTVAASPSGVQDTFTATTAASSGGAITDDVDYDYTSSVSLSAFPTQTFLGGASGDLMALGVGSTFAKAGWSKLSNSSVCDWKGSTTRVRNRSKSFKFDGAANGDVGNTRGTYQMDCTAYTRLFYRMVAYWQINPSFPGCQWKMLRHQTVTDHTGGGGPEVVDGNPPSAYWSNSTARDNMPYSQFTSNVPNWQQGNANTQAGYNTSDFGFTVAAPQNQWFLLEHYFQENSNTSTSDGVGRIKITLANGTSWIDATTSNRLYRGPNDYSAGTNPFRYFIMQNYFGNDTDPSSFGDSVLHFDDLMVVPSPSGGASPYIRCEITDGVSEPVIQPWVAAGCSGTARRIKPNKGHLTTFTGCTLNEYGASNTVVYSKVL